MSIVQINLVYTQSLETIFTSLFRPGGGTVHDKRAILSKTIDEFGCEENLLAGLGVGFEEGGDLLFVVAQLARFHGGVDVSGVPKVDASREGGREDRVDSGLRGGVAIESSETHGTEADGADLDA